MVHLSPAQIASAFGKTFTVPGVLNGSAEVSFWGIYPSGNVGVKRGRDPDHFGPVTVPAEQAEPLLKAIAARFNRRGYRAHSVSIQA